MAGKTIPITPAQIRAARALVGWSQEDLATNAGVGLGSVRDYENERRDGSGEAGALKKICRALDNKGVLFLSGEGDLGPGVRLVARVPNVLRRPVKLGPWDELPFVIEWRGQEYTVLVSRDVLDDLGRFRESRPDSEYARVFEAHRGSILRAAANVIDSGRYGLDRRVSLVVEDIPELN